MNIIAHFLTCFEEKAGEILSCHEELLSSAPGNLRSAVWQIAAATTLDSPLPLWLPVRVIERTCVVAKEVTLPIETINISSKRSQEKKYLKNCLPLPKIKLYAYPPSNNYLKSLLSAYSHCSGNISGITVSFQIALKLVTLTSALVGGKSIHFWPIAKIVEDS